MSPSVSVRLLLTQSDARLVAFARAGHERAFEALVQRYRRSLLGYCRRLLLSDERAEDALQQALLQAWLALRADAQVGDVKPWLYRIVHNAALNALRMSGYDYCKLSESLSGADAPQEDLDRRIAVREALAGLAALPEMQREALLRTAVEGGSHQRVARELGLSENALRGLVYRARAALRAAASAIIPPPLVSWALGAGGRGAPAIERLAGLGAGGGSAGVTGLLMKGGTVAVTASVLAGGIAAVHAHPRPGHGRHSASRASHRIQHRGTTTLLLTADRAASVAAMPDTLQRLDGKPPPIHRAIGHKRARQPIAMPFTTRIAPPPNPALSGTHEGDEQRGRADGTGGQSHQTQDNEANVPGSAIAVRGGDGGHEPENAQPGSEAGGSSRHDRSDGGSSSESSSKGSPGGRQIAGDGTTNQSRPVESSDRQLSPGMFSPIGTSSPPKDEPGSIPERTKGD
jgi:RNA polymerase sigma factor (sigma-70 family)